MANIQGATPTGTQSYFKRHFSIPSLPLGKTNWQISRLGFGTYRVESGNSTHQAALKKALLSGINLIDTSTNYGDGLSEVLVGQVIRDLIKEGKISREEIVVVTKAGYVQGENLKLARERKAQGKPFSEMTEYQSQCWHCISPDFLEDQIDRSLDRLRLEQIDVLLLHNPEYFLKATGDHAEYYQRIEKAFQYLETEVARGRIQAYGVSSNTFGEPKESPEFTSLEILLDLAAKAGPHFQVIQFPFNLFEPGAALEPNQSHGTLLDLAAQKSLGTLANRPLNAFFESKLIRLADFPPHEDQDVEGNVQRLLQGTAQLESMYPGKDRVPFRDIAWAHILQQNFSKIGDIDGWKSVLLYQIKPTLENAYSKLTAPEDAEWVERYQVASNQLFAAVTVLFESQIAQRSLHISAELIQQCPRLKNSPTLSQKCLRIYQSTPGLHSILLGMRRPEYVEDALHFQPLLSREETSGLLARERG